MWNDLSMAERTAYIKLGLDNGIIDLNTIRDTYNKYAKGGAKETENNWTSYLPYTPSASIVGKITGWEGTSMETNRPIEDEARDFYNNLSPYIRNTATQEALDNMFSQSYNTGSSRWRNKVMPVIEDFYRGKVTPQKLVKTTVHPKDNHPNYTGFRARRREEWSDLLRNAVSDKAVDTPFGRGKIIGFDDDGHSTIIDEDNKVRVYDSLELPNLTIKGRKQNR